MKSYIERIQQVYSDLVVNQCEHNENGQNNDVLMVNESLVFRFPKYEKGIEQLSQETAILEAIHNRLKLPNLIHGIDHSNQERSVRFLKATI
ncbi:hypothetical protein [Paenisporosarcina sp.]|uniref:hypothetical protein n=1 Tax=Paenisporosarcina sp. TaxID=1932001 RepID=UPI003C72241A